MSRDLDPSRSGKKHFEVSSTFDRAKNVEWSEAVEIVRRHGRALSYCGEQADDDERNVARR